MSQFPTTEKSRIGAFNKRREIEVMCDYLIKRQEDNGAVNIKDIVLWS